MRALILILLLTVSLILGCVFGYTNMPFGTGYAALYQKYPECQQYETMGDFMSCTHEIELKEGKVR